MLLIVEMIYDGQIFGLSPEQVEILDVVNLVMHTNRVVFHLDVRILVNILWH